MSEVLENSRVLIDPLDFSKHPDDNFLHITLTTLENTKTLVAGEKVCQDKIFYACVMGAVKSTGRSGRQLASFRKYIEFDQANIRPLTSWLQELIIKHRTKDLQCFLSATLFNIIVRTMIESEFKPMCEQLLQFVHEKFQLLVKSCYLSRDSSRYPLLRSYVSSKLENIIAYQYENTLKQLQELLARESFPYTQNCSLFEIINKKRNQSMRQSFLQVIRSLSGDVSKEAAEVIVKSVFSRNECKSMLEHVTLEMEITLDAYGNSIVLLLYVFPLILSFLFLHFFLGKVAIKRIIDDVPMVISSMLDSILQQLEDEIKVTDDQLAHFMEEKADLVYRRELIKEELHKMELARNAIEKVLNRCF